MSSHSHNPESMCHHIQLPPLWSKSLLHAGPLPPWPWLLTSLYHSKQPLDQKFSIHKAYSLVQAPAKNGCLLGSNCFQIPQIKLWFIIILETLPWVESKLGSKVKLLYLISDYLHGEGYLNDWDKITHPGPSNLVPCTADITRQKTSIIGISNIPENHLWDKWKLHRLIRKTTRHILLTSLCYTRSSFLIWKQNLKCLVEVFKAENHKEIMTTLTCSIW